MAYLFLDIIKASGLKARENKPNGMSDPFCHVVVGKERARTRIVQVCTARLEERATAPFSACRKLTGACRVCSSACTTRTP
jgi:hypothetical protein